MSRIPILSPSRMTYGGGKGSAGRKKKKKREGKGGKKTSIVIRYPSLLTLRIAAGKKRGGGKGKEKGKGGRADRSYYPSSVSKRTEGRGGGEVKNRKKGKKETDDVSLLFTPRSDEAGKRKTGEKEKKEGKREKKRLILSLLLPLQGKENMGGGDNLP